MPWDTEAIPIVPRPPAALIREEILPAAEREADADVMGWRYLEMDDHDRKTFAEWASFVVAREGSVSAEATDRMCVALILDRASGMFSAAMKVADALGDEVLHEEIEGLYAATAAIWLRIVRRVIPERGL